MTERRKFVEAASGSFMTITVSISRWDGIAKLKRGAAQAAHDAGAKPEVFSGYVKMLGAHHADLKLVNSKYAAIRTYLYDNSLPFSQASEGRQQRGDRLIPVCRVPEVLKQLKRLKAEADEALAKFLPEYNRLIAIARSADLGRWAQEVHYPSAEQVSSRFVCEISPPRAIPPVDMKAFGTLPAKLAEEIATANAALLEKQLDSAKSAAMEAAKAQMETVTQQLASGQRLHQSLVDNSKRCARMLRDMTEGYDRDPRVLALAELMEEKIAAVGDVAIWKDMPHRRTESLRAAETVSKGLADLQKAKAKAPAQPAGKVELGGALADLF